jgi:uncharacterized protein (DUF697 family)
MSTFLGRYKSDLKRIHESRFDEAPEEERARSVQDLIHTSCTTAAAAALQPVPFLDTAILVPMHVTLMREIAHVRGRKLDKKTALELLWTFRANLLTQHSMMAGAKFVPYLGWMVTVSAAHALTYSLGQVMEMYFRGNCEMPDREMREKLKSLYKEDFERVYRQRSNELKAKLGRAPEVRKKLHELDRQCREGRIDERERQRRKEKVLDAG